MRTRHAHTANKKRATRVGRSRTMLAFRSFCVFGRSDFHNVTRGGMFRLRSDQVKARNSCIAPVPCWTERKSTRLNSSHSCISYAVFCLKKKNPSEDRKRVHQTYVDKKTEVTGPTNQ